MRPLALLFVLVGCTAEPDTPVDLATPPLPPVPQEPYPPADVAFLSAAYVWYDTEPERPHIDVFLFDYEDGCERYAAYSAAVDAVTRDIGWPERIDDPDELARWADAMEAAEAGMPDRRTLVLLDLMAVAEENDGPSGYAGFEEGCTYEIDNRFCGALYVDTDATDWDQCAVSRANGLENGCGVNTGVRTFGGAASLDGFVPGEDLELTLGTDVRDRETGEVAHVLDVAMTVPHCPVLAEVRGAL
ncbi:MAG: hypothetical protein R3F61_01540 [Myxococcota bacterium]